LAFIFYFLSFSSLINLLSLAWNWNYYWCFSSINSYLSFSNKLHFSVSYLIFYFKLTDSERWTSAVFILPSNFEVSSKINYCISDFSFLSSFISFYYLTFDFSRVSIWVFKFYIVSDYYSDLILYFLNFWSCFA